jgi:predicted ATP-grasp superfamily ATP-dependent carboligase
MYIVKHSRRRGSRSGRQAAARCALLGIATVEFRRDANTGALKLIKVDPRVVRATSLPAAVGIDLPAALFAYSLRSRRQSRRDTLTASRGSGSARSSQRSTNRGCGHSGVPAHCYAIWRIRAAAYFSRHDPMPFIIDSSQSAGRYIRGRLRAVKRRVLRNMRPSETAR